jgi:hypothetical protein
MKDVSNENFGVIIAFWLPGFILLWGLSLSMPHLSAWLAHPPGTVDGATVGDFLYATLASLALGLLISAVRWLVVDNILRYSKTLPTINFANLTDKDVFAAFLAANENHYRYYQYYSNTLIAILVAFIFYLLYGPQHVPFVGWIVVLLAIGILFLASRDAFTKYHERAAAITSNKPSSTSGNSED